MKKTKPGDVKVKLNFNHRFFLEDMAYGLVILKDIGNIVGVKTPVIGKHILFHQQYMDIKFLNEKTKEFNKEALKKSGAPSAYGITTIQALVKTSLC